MRDLFDNGVSALDTFRRAITTTSHNIANVNTEGYSRQRVLTATQHPDRTSVGALGNGVRVLGVERIASEFATARVFDTTAQHARDDTHLALAARIDNLLAGDALSVAPTIDSFFAALEDAATDPGAQATRQAAIAGGNELATRFNTLHDQLSQTAVELDGRRAAAVDTLNELAESLARINTDLTSHHGTGRERFPADLLDERERLVAAMAEQTDVRVLEQDNGALNVSIGNGIALVTDREVNTLSVEGGERPGLSRVMVEQGGAPLDIGGRLDGGILGGLDAFARQTLEPATHRLGQLAHAFVATINEAHAAGIDRRGDAGGEWFSIGAPRVAAANGNAGAGIPDVSVQDASALQPSDYDVRFDGAAWRITRTSDGAITTGSSPIALDGLAFTLPAGAVAGDSFTVSATGTAAGSMRAMLGDPDALALAAPIRGDTPLGNTGDTRIDALAAIDPQDPDHAAEVLLTFTAPDRYDLVDVSSGTPLASGVAWQSGDTISANGWALTLSGAPSAGDRHRVVPNLDGGNDNGNALGMAALKRAASVGGSDSFSESYGSLASEIGTRTRALQTRSDTLSALKSEALTRREAISGVDIDEEAINLARHEQAYQAAAQVIATADELFQTILGAVR